MELENNPSQGPAIPEPRPKRKYRKRRKRGKSRLQVVPSLSPKPEASSESISDSEPAPTGLREETLEEAGAAVLAESGIESPDNRIVEVPEDAGPDFEKMVAVYLPKPFQLAALLLEDRRIELSEIQQAMLVPQGALCLEELWPFLPEFFKNSRFKHTYAFIVSMSLIASPNVIQAWRTYKEKQAIEAQPSTQTAASAA